MVKTYAQGRCARIAEYEKNSITKYMNTTDVFLLLNIGRANAYSAEKIVKNNKNKKKTDRRSES